MLPYESFQVTKIETRPDIGVMVFCAIGRSACYVLAKDVELLTACICSPALTRTCGCKCGWQIKLDAEEREKKKVKAGS